MPIGTYLEELGLVRHWHGAQTICTLFTFAHWFPKSIQFIVESLLILDPFNFFFLSTQIHVEQSATKLENVEESLGLKMSAQILVQISLGSVGTTRSR